MLLAKLNLCKGDWALIFVSIQIEIFLKFPDFLKSLVLSRSATREATRMPKLLDYLSRLVSLVANLFLLKHCKVQKYCDQDCLKIFFFLSALPVIIQVFGKNTHWLQKCQSSQKNYQ